MTRNFAFNGGMHTLRTHAARIFAVAAIFATLWTYMVHNQFADTVLDLRRPDAVVVVQPDGQPVLDDTPEARFLNPLTAMQISVVELAAGQPFQVDPGTTVIVSAPETVAVAQRQALAAWQDAHGLAQQPVPLGWTGVALGLLLIASAPLRSAHRWAITSTVVGGVLASALTATVIPLETLVPFLAAPALVWAAELLSDLVRMDRALAAPGATAPAARAART